MRSAFFPWLAAAILCGGLVPARGGDTVCLRSHDSLYAVAPRADRLAVVPENASSSIEIWDSGKRLKSQTVPVEGEGKVRCLAISDDGRTVAAGTAAREVSLWRAESRGGLVTGHKLALTGDVSRLWLSPNGERVAAKTSEGLVVCESKSGAVAATIPVNATPLLVAFADDSGKLTAIWPNEVWQWQPGQASPERKRIDSEELVIHSAASSPDGRTLAVATGQGVEVWRADGFRRSPPLDYDSQVRLAISPDGSRLLCLKSMGGKHQIDVWRLAGGAPPRFQQTIADLAGEAFAVSPDGATLAAVAEDGSVIRLSGLREGQDETLGKPSQFGEASPVTIQGLAFSPDGKRLASFTGRTVRIWSLESKSVSGQFEEQTGLAVGRLVGAGEVFLGTGADGSIAMHRLGSALRPIVRRSFDFTTSYGYSAGFKGLDITPDGRLVAVVVGTGKVVFIDAVEGKERGFQKLSPNLLRFSRDGNRLALVSDSETHLYDVPNGTLNEVQYVPSFVTPPEPDRYFYGVCNDKMTLWDPRTGRIAQQFHPQAVNRAGQWALSWDGTKFALLSRKKNDYDAYGIELFEVSSGRSITFVPLHLDSWHAIAFSPDDRRILVATCHSIELVDYRSGQIAGRIVPEAKPLEHDTNRAMAVSKNGWIATATVTGTVILWRYDSGRAVETLYNQKGIIERICLSENGDRLAYIQDKTVHVIDVLELTRSASR